MISTVQLVSEKLHLLLESAKQARRIPMTNDNLNSMNSVTEIIGADELEIVKAQCFLLKIPNRQDKMDSHSTDLQHYSRETSSVKFA